MKRVLTAVVLIPLVLLAVFKAPSWLFTLLCGAVALLALKEYLDLVEAYGVKPLRWLSYFVVAAGLCVEAWINFISLGYLFQPTAVTAAVSVVVAIIFISPFLFLVAAMRQPELLTAFPSAAASAFGTYYVGASLVCVATLQDSGWYPLIFTFFAVWAGDIVAMYTGKAIGRHKMSRRISPNKTWEGAIGSVVGSVVACWLLTYFALRIAELLHNSGQIILRVHPAWLFILFAVVINIAAQLGDLVESLIKRGAGVKDSGTMLPGHGGILDRIDALLFAAPVALILFDFVRYK